MENFFGQIKIILADHITDFSASRGPRGWSYNVDIELNYRDYKIEIDYARYLVLSIDLESTFDLEILPKGFFDRLFDVQAGISLFDTAQKIKIKIPSSAGEVLAHTNNEMIARGFLSSTDVSKIIDDYGITFFKIECGELKVYLSELSTGKFEELKSNPALITKYLDIIVDLAAYLKTGSLPKG